jgi:hypothetical protein
MLWQDQAMRRKAHYLMWPHKPYVEEQTAPSFQRGGSLRQQPRGILQYMSLRGIQTVRAPHRALQQQGIGADGQTVRAPYRALQQQGIGTDGQTVRSPYKALLQQQGIGTDGQTVRAPYRALQQQGTGANRDRLQSPLVKQSVSLKAAPSPNAARVPYKPLAGPSDKYSMYSRSPNGAGVRYEAAKPVKDAVRVFEKKN